MNEAKSDRKPQIVLIAIALFVVVGGVALGLMATSGRQNDPAASRDAGPVGHTDELPVTATADAVVDGATRDVATADRTAQADAVTDAGAGAKSHAEVDASGQINEEGFIRISVRIAIAAIGFKNAGQGHAELQAYVPELLAEEGVTAEALQQATDELMKDPEQAERVGKEIAERVERITGVQMDMSLLQQLDPNWKPEAR